MVTSHRSNQGKPARQRWHARREEARETFMSDEEASPEDRVEFDLDNDDPLYPARIYGDQNPATYKIVGEGGEEYDYRDQNPRV